MTWGAVAGAAVGVVGSAMSSGGGSQTNGGAGTQTQTKEPWAAAQPWIMNNLQQGQNLQNAYTAQPFSQLQNDAYTNQGNQSAYMRQAIPSLLGQIGSQQVGFDRNNPNARPTAFNFNGAAQAGQQGQATYQAQQPQGGLLSMLNGSGGGNLDLNASAVRGIAPPPPAAAAPFTTPYKFTEANLNPFERAAYAATANDPAGRAQFEATHQAMPGSYSNNDYQDPMYALMAQLRNGGFGFGGGHNGGFGGPSVGVDGIGVAGSDAAVGSSANF